MSLAFLCLQIQLRCKGSSCAGQPWRQTTGPPLGFLRVWWAWLQGEHIPRDVVCWQPDTTAPRWHLEERSNRLRKAWMLKHQLYTEPEWHKARSSWPSRHEGQFGARGGQGPPLTQSQRRRNTSGWLPHGVVMSVTGLSRSHVGKSLRALEGRADQSTRHWKFTEPLCTRGWVTANKQGTCPQGIDLLVVKELIGHKARQTDPWNRREPRNKRSWWWNDFHHDCQDHSMEK